MHGDESTVTSVGFTPDSSYLATGSSGGELRLWDARYGHSVPIAMKAEAHDLGVSGLHFSPAIGKEGEFDYTIDIFLSSSFSVLTTAPLLYFFDEEFSLIYVLCGYMCLQIMFHDISFFNLHLE